MTFNELSPELREKAQTCKTPEEMLELAKDEGIELSEADMESISGGWGSDEHAVAWGTKVEQWESSPNPNLDWGWEPTPVIKEWESSPNPNLA